ncbi:MAG: hypothetical protein HQL54_06525 [Magnetococcales bacterium]|nr:hypothetical protein [Magnetococcales bacterium]
MNHKKGMWLSGLLMLMALVFAACAPVEEFAKRADQMEARGQYSSAVRELQKGLKEAPGNPLLTKSMQRIKTNWANHTLGEARSASRDMDQSLARRLKAGLTLAKQAKNIADTAAISSFITKMEAELKSISDRQRKCIEAGNEALKNESVIDAARTTLRRCIEEDPDNSEVQDLSAKVNRRWGDKVYMEADEALKKGQEELALMLIDRLLKVDAKYPGAVLLRKQADGAATARRRLVKVRSFMEEGASLRALEAYRSIDPNNVRVNESLAVEMDSIVEQLGNTLLRQARDLMATRRLGKAMLRLEGAVDVLPSVRFTPEAESIIRKLENRALSFQDEGLLGNAYYAFLKLKKIAQWGGRNRDVMDELHHQLRERNIVTISLVDFGTPSNEPDAGTYFTSQLTNMLFERRESDLKIVERERIKDVIKELQLDTSGMTSMESAKKIGHIQGIDYFIFGNVVEYQVETVDQPTQRTVKVEVGRRKIPNPAFQTFILMNPNTWQEMMRQGVAPQKTIEEAQHQLIQFQEGTIAKRTTGNLYMRIIEVERGDIFTTRAFKKKHEESDHYSDGVGLANIQADPKEIASDKAMLGKISKEILDEASSFVLDLFADRETSKSTTAANLVKQGDMLSAVEKWVDAWMIAETKKKEVKPFVQGATDAVLEAW